MPAPCPAAARGSSCCSRHDPPIVFGNQVQPVHEEGGVLWDPAVGQRPERERLRLIFEEMMVIEVGCPRCP